MQTLSVSLVLTRSGATRLIDRIEKAGLVRREAAAEDRRGYYAILTEEGQKVLATEMTRLIHGEQGLAQAERATDALFSSAALRSLTSAEAASVFADAPHVELHRVSLDAEGGATLLDVAVPHSNLYLLRFCRAGSIAVC